MNQPEGYIITGTLAQNDSISIFRGYRITDNLPILIKQLNDTHNNISLLNALKHEFEINRTLKSENILCLYEINLKSLNPYIIMEDSGGDFLNKILLTTEFALPMFLNLSIKIVDALADLHYSNLIHNTISPSNILVNTTLNTVKLTNLISSEAFSKNLRKSKDLSIDSSFVNYISPEQTGRINRSIDYRTDFYSLGVTLYEMLTNKLPFYGEDAVSILYCHLAKEPIPPHILNPLIPKPLSSIIMKLLEKNADNRYQSAAGLKKDLDKCLHLLDAHDSIEDFTIGKNDISYRFGIPQKMYGRDEDLDKLNLSFDKVISGNIEFVSVTGYSGIGKSTFVNEIRSSVIKQHGIFAMGKNEELHNNKSYYSLILIFEEIIAQILSENKTVIDTWKQVLLNNLGKNSKLMVDFIPTLASIIGEQPSVPELPSNEAYNRLNFTFKKFITAFASSAHPLVLFFDDAQWIDSATLRFIESLILDNSLNHIMLVISYRSNDFSRVHPLNLTLTKLRNNGYKITNIHLKPLALTDISKLLSDTLSLSEKGLEEFSTLCFKKTAGNPFFLNQFLQYLYDETLIWFDVPTHSWNYDLSQIEAVGITDNVVELMLRKIQKLSFSLQELLTYAACVGNKFDIPILSKISGIPITEIMALTDSAINEGLIFKKQNAPLMIQNNISLSQSYQFLHDRIHHAFYTLLDESRLKQLHLKIGRLLYEVSTDSDRFDNVYDILNHYNIGIDLVCDDDEKVSISKLELMAAKNAKKTGAYEIAYRYLKIGVSLLNSNCWDEYYELTLSLFTEMTEITYLLSFIPEMEEVTELISNHSRTVFDRINACKFLVIAYASQGNKSRAIDTAIFLVKLLGIKIRREPNKFWIFSGFVKTRLSLMKYDNHQLINLPFMNDPKNTSLISIFALIGSLTYRTDPLFMSYILVVSIQLTLKHGFTNVSPFFLSGYGLIACSLGNIDSGYEFSKLSMDLIEKYSLYDQKAKVIFLNNAFINHWKEPLDDLLEIFRDGYECGLQYGDYEFASYNGFYYCNKSFYAGKNLQLLEQEMQYFNDSIKKLNQPLQLYLTQMMYQLVLNLEGKNSDPLFLSGEIYDEATMLQFHKDTMDATAECSVYIIKLMLNYIFNDYENAKENSKLTGKYIDSLRSTVAVVIFYFFSALTDLAMYHSAPLKMKRQIIKNTNSAIKKMKNWSKHCNENYLHKYFLLMAEKARVLCDDLNAIKYYDLAIITASKNGFIQDEALANELIANFYISNGNAKLGRFYLIASYNCYQKWGAAAKVKQLMQKYATKFDLNISHILSSDEIYSVENNKLDSSNLIDTAAIVKASQAISSEIKLEELLRKLIKILLENSGAERISYVVKREDQFFVIAEGFDSIIDIKVDQKIPLDSYDGLPKRIINYVINSNHAIIIDNTDKETNFRDDIYIKKFNPKSILCIPVISKNELSGLLYFENNLNYGAFSNELIEIIMVLASQLAISIENANMYRNLEALNNNLELKVISRTKELNNSLEKVFLLLNNSGEGFLTFNYNFIIGNEYSSECKIIFNMEISGKNILQLLFEDNSQDSIIYGNNIRLAIDTDDLYKRDLILSLLPSTFKINSKSVKIKYTILNDKRVMLVITDITREIELESKVKIEEQHLKFIVSACSNKENTINLINDFKAFLEIEIDSVLNSEISLEAKYSNIYRAIHTFKGNFSQYDFINLPIKLNELESRLSLIYKTAPHNLSEIFEIINVQLLSNALNSDLKILSDTLGNKFFQDNEKIYIDKNSSNVLKEAFNLVAKNSELSKHSIILKADNIVKTIDYKNLKDLLFDYPTYTIKLAVRLNKIVSEFVIEGDNIMVDPIKFQPLTKSLVHIFRNAVDHGIETPDDRIEAGKSEVGKISCSIEDKNDRIIITIQDDGRGIDIEEISKKATEKDIITREDLSKLNDHDILMLIFKENFSTCNKADDISGRGYGLSAVKAEIEAINGTIDLETSLNAGTKFVLNVNR